MAISACCSRMTAFFMRHAILLCGLPVLSLAFIVYLPGLSGPFAFDDFPNIQTNYYLAIQHLDIDSLKRAAFSGNSGPLKRPISMLSFALNYYATGFNPFYFKLTNLVIHLFNGIGIYTLTGLILRIYRQRFQPRLTSHHIQWLSLALATAWLLHPLNLTSVLYVVQRMTSLASLFTIVGLILYLSGRWLMLQGKSGGILRILLGLLVFMPLATLSKENGALLPLLMLVLEITLLNFETVSTLHKRFLIGFFLITVVLPGSVVLIYLATHSGWLTAGFELRDFTLSERVLTEIRVMWFYIKMIVLPRTAELGLFHDDIQLSRGLLNPISTLFSAAGLLALIAAAVGLRKRQPIFSLGILFFLAGHLLESTVFALEITFEHRNYLPMFGILLIMFYYLLYPLTHLKTLRFRQCAALGLISLFAVSTNTRAEQWVNTFLLTNAELTHHPLSPRANAEVGAIYGNLALITRQQELADQFYQASRAQFEKSVSLQKYGVDGLFGLIYYAAYLNKPIEKIWIDHLSDYLEHAPFSSNASDKLHRLVTCHGEGKCKLPKEDIKSLLDAALRNPTLSGMAKAAMLSAMAYHLANIEGDTPGALRATYQAMQAVPDIVEYRSSLVGFLIAVREFDAARKELQAARKQDFLNTNTQVLGQLEKALDDAEKQAKPKP